MVVGRQEDGQPAAPGDPAALQSNLPREKKQCRMGATGLTGRFIAACHGSLSISKCNSFLFKVIKRQSEKRAAQFIIF